MQINALVRVLSLAFLFACGTSARAEAPGDSKAVKQDDKGKYLDVKGDPTFNVNTLMVINTVGHLAEAAWHHPDLTASYAWVEVRLQNHAAKGITDKDFELAKKIEDVVLWQPGKEGGALEGTPADQRFAYIDYKKSHA